jgi:hypothetical protein
MTQNGRTVEITLMFSVLWHYLFSSMQCGLMHVDGARSIIDGVCL